MLGQEESHCQNDMKPQYPQNQRNQELVSILKLNYSQVERGEKKGNLTEQLGNISYG